MKEQVHIITYVVLASRQYNNTTERKDDKKVKFRPKPQSGPLCAKNIIRHFFYEKRQQWDDIITKFKDCKRRYLKNAIKYWI